MPIETVQEVCDFTENRNNSVYFEDDCAIYTQKFKHMNDNEYYLLKWHWMFLSENLIDGNIFLNFYKMVISNGAEIQKKNVVGVGYKVRGAIEAYLYNYEVEMHRAHLRACDLLKRYPNQGSAQVMKMDIARGLPWWDQFCVIHT